MLNGHSSPKITKQSLGINKKMIFNHGNIEKRKNQLNLMQAFLNSGLKKDYQLVLLGSPRCGNDLGYFKLCKECADENESITMIKGTNNQTVINSLLNIADAYVLPSTAEGLPLVLLEAMSAGLPWVSTPVGGVPKVLGDFENGKIMHSFEMNDFEECIRQVKGKNSRPDWESNFNIDRAGKQYSQLLEGE